MTTPVTIGGIVTPDSELARKAAALVEQAHSKVLLINAPETRRFPVKTIAECVPAVATLITGAVATFDADPGASRRYLMRASAILQACAAHDREKTREARSRGQLAHWQLTRILDYIEQHLAERMTGEKLARLIGVSIGQLFRAFKVSVGIPPLQYVASRRLELVCRLLRTTQEPLCQIAVSAGFCDQSHLCRVFRRVLGATPTAWRGENAVGPDVEFGKSPKSAYADRHKRSLQGARFQVEFGRTVRPDDDSSPCRTHAATFRVNPYRSSPKAVEELRSCQQFAAESGLGEPS